MHVAGQIGGAKCVHPLTSVLPPTVFRARVARVGALRLRLGRGLDDTPRMNRGLTVTVALVAFAWGACNVPRPTPYSGGPGIPNWQQNNNNNNNNQPGGAAGGAGAPADAGVADAAAETPAPAPSPIIGVWQSNDQTLDIRNDGTIVINGKSFTYAIGGQTLFVQGPDGSAASYPFEQSGEQLIVTVNNQRVVYTRKPLGIAPPGG
jgi:hypothetical protein